MQQELLNADATDIIHQHLDAQLLTLNKLRDRSIYTEELDIQAGNAFKHFVSATYSMEQREKVNLLIEVADIDIRPEFLAVFSGSGYGELLSGMQLQKGQDCSSVAKIRYISAAEELVENIDRAVEAGVPLGQNSYRNQLLNHAVSSIALKTYLLHCK